ncbi:hypothetical protein QE152_g5241 [Popillia japonica]|uniref:Uncharacterized protein n=1 Tax=Popillia japonica TaxID=7064 RepID=A0AAW1MJ74_POPJA
MTDKDEEDGDGDDLREMNISNLPKATARLFNEPMTDKDEEDGDGDDLREMNISNLPKATARLWAKYSVVIPPNHVGEETIIRAGRCEENLHEDGTIMEVLDEEVRENCADRTKKILTSCDIATEFDISQRKVLQALVTRYPTCSALDVKELGCYSETPVRIELTSEEKVTYRPYRLGHYERRQCELS